MKSYSLIYLTNIPAFYKINLFNKINEKRSLLVIYTNEDKIKREDDFFVGKSSFDYILLNEQNKDIIQLLKNYKYDELIIGGWDRKAFWKAAIFCPRNKNSLALESSVLESTTKGMKGWLKKVFLSRIGKKIYASGMKQIELLEKLSFKGEIKKTGGVGLYNRNKSPEFLYIHEVNNFLYVGRLSPEKNLNFLIDYFNDNSHLKLNIVGNGVLEEKLKKKANNNISFTGHIDNEKLINIYRQSHVFILPSLREPWGLVVEEALNNGIPVVVSNNVGCIGEVVIDGVNGLVFSLESTQSLNDVINKITKPDYYNFLKNNVLKTDFELIERNQVNAYL